MSTHNTVLDRRSNDQHELKSESRETGRALAREFFDDRIISLSRAEVISEWWVEFGDYEAWLNLCKHLGKDVSRDLSDILKDKEGDGHVLYLEDVGAGFFEAVAERFAAYRSQQQAFE